MTREKPGLCRGKGVRICVNSRKGARGWDEGPGAPKSVELGSRVCYGEWGEAGVGISGQGLLEEEPANGRLWREGAGESTGTLNSGAAVLDMDAEDGIRSANVSRN